MRWKGFVGLLVLMAAACSLASAPNEQGLRPGRYRVQFDIAAGTSVPAFIVGHHDFTFVVAKPTTVAESFALVSSTLGSQASYLTQLPNETVPQSSSWNISWRFVANSDYRVNIVMNEELSGQFSYPRGCHVLSDADDDFLGSNCSVVRAD